MISDRFLRKSVKIVTLNKKAPLFRSAFEFERLFDYLKSSMALLMASICLLMLAAF